MRFDERKFYAVLEEWRERPYDWHTANCCHFAADVLKSWGVRYAVPDFDTPADADEWIKGQGVRSLYHLLVKYFGTGKQPLAAGRGAIVYRKGLGVEGSAIGTADRGALFVGERGLIHAPLSSCARAFDPGKFRG